MDSKYQSLPFESEKSPVTSSEICSSLADSDDLDFEKHEVDPRTSSVRERLSPALLWPVHAVLFMMSFTFFVLALTLRPTTLDHVQQFSAWSPAEAAVRYEKVKYNITTDDNNPFVGAGRTVDKAWREISYDVGDQWISKAEIAKLGMPKTSLKVNHPTTGVEGYRVGMEVFHHLHCLNLLRRVTYREYYEPLGGEFAEGPEALKGHTGDSFRPSCAGQYEAKTPPRSLPGGT